MEGITEAKVCKGGLALYGSDCNGAGKICVYLFFAIWMVN